MNNTRINTIPNKLINLERLDIVNNKNIITLPVSLTELINLYLCDCSMLDNIHNYPNLQYLFVSKCNKIIKIHNLNNLIDMYIYIIVN